MVIGNRPVKLPGLKLANRAIRSISAHSKSSRKFPRRDDDKTREREGERERDTVSSTLFPRDDAVVFDIWSPLAGNVSNERGNDLAVIFRFSTAKHVGTTEAIAPK